jgi:hypothetical protein
VQALTGQNISALVLKTGTDLFFYKGDVMTGQRFTEYKMVHITEGGCGTLLLGSSGLPLKKIEAELNRYAAEGWQVVFQVLEMKRFWLFWQRESVIVTLGR